MSFFVGLLPFCGGRNARMYYLPAPTQDVSLGCEFMGLSQASLQGPLTCSHLHLSDSCPLPREGFCLLASPGFGQWVVWQGANGE